MTSIEFLQQCLNQHLTFGQQMQFEGLFQQAKEMHKQEIIEAVSYGNQKELMASQKLFAEQYYNEVFKKD